MSRQHRLPYLMTAGEPPRVLEPARASFDEDWLQAFVYEHPAAIPVDEIEPAFGPLLPLCRELPTDAGPVDLAFVNPVGLITLVECKLWKNPEARRQVIGQILDYAKEVARWDFDRLQSAVRTARGDQGISLWAEARQGDDSLDEGQFVDAVSRNLRRGRFLLLLLGDGIRESTSRIAEYLDEHAHLNFALGLVEMGVYRLPDRGDASYVVLPRVVAQTVEIDKAVVRIEEGRVVLSAPAARPAEATPQRTKISEQVFMETAAVDAGVRQALVRFLSDAKDLGCYVEPGSNSLKLKSVVRGFNFANFTAAGEIWNTNVASMTQEMGHPEIGEAYLNALADLMPGGYVMKTKNRFYWTVKVKPDRYPTIAEGMDRSESWLELIKRTNDELTQLEDE